MRSLVHALSFSMLAGVVAVGCSGSDTNSAQDAGGGVDAGADTRSPPPVDAAGHTDSCTGPSCTPVDVDMPIDANTPVDANASLDANMPVDAGPADANTPVDANARTDAGVPPTDASCALAGQSCTADDRCCGSELCLGGTTCGACRPPAGACVDNHDCCGFDCCNGVCITGTCTTCPAAGPTCNTALFVDPSQANHLCGVPQQDYAAVESCMCMGPCYPACATSFCAGLAPNTACDSCSNTMGASGCGNQLQACAAN